MGRKLEEDKVILLDRTGKKDILATSAKEDPVDLWGFLVYALKRIWLVLLVTVACAGSVWGYFNTKYVPAYTSEGTIYLVAKVPEGAVSIGEISYTNMLMNDYIYHVSDEATMRKAVSIIPEEYRNCFGEKYSEAELNEKIAKATASLTWGALKGASRIENVEDTHFLKLQVKSTDKELAYVAACALVHASLESLSDFYGLEIQTISIQKEPVQPLYPSTSFPYGYIIFAGILGAAAVLVILFVLFVRDDKIKNSEDVEKHLGLAVLAMIPAYEDMVSTQSSKKKVR